MIENLMIEGLGPIKSRRFAFKPGANILRGACAKGKTTTLRTLECLLSGAILPYQLTLNRLGRMGSFAQADYTGGRATLRLNMGKNRRKFVYSASGSPGNFMYLELGTREDLDCILEEAGREDGIRLFILDDVLSMLDPQNTKRLFNAFEGRKDIQLIASVRDAWGVPKHVNLVKL